MLGRRVVVYGGGNTALDVARTAKRLGATESIIVYRRTREKMPAHDFEVEEALQEGVLIKWLSTIKNMADEGTLTVEKMALDDKGFPQPTGEVETLEADSLVLALGQDVDLSLLDGVPGLAIKDGIVQVDPNMMTGHAGIFAGGDMVPSERTVTVGVGHGKKAARNIDAWLRGTRLRAPAEARARRVRQAQPLVLQRRAEDRAADARARAPDVDLRRGRQRARRDQRAVRGAPLPLLRQLLRVRQLLRRLPGQRGDQARARASASSSTSTTARAAASAFPSARAARSRWFRKRSDRRRPAVRAVPKHGDERCRSKPMTMHVEYAFRAPKGVALLQDPALNKGTAFTDAERDALRSARPVAAARRVAGAAAGARAREFPPQVDRPREVHQPAGAARPQRDAVLPPADATIPTR